MAAFRTPEALETAPRFDAHAGIEGTQAMREAELAAFRTTSGMRLNALSRSVPLEEGGTGKPFEAPARPVRHAGEPPPID